MHVFGRLILDGDLMVVPPRLSCTHVATPETSPTPCLYVSVLRSLSSLYVLSVRSPFVQIQLERRRVVDRSTAHGTTRQHAHRIGSFVRSICRRSSIRVQVESSATTGTILLLRLESRSGARLWSRCYPCRARRPTRAATSRDRSSHGVAELLTGTVACTDVKAAPMPFPSSTDHMHQVHAREASTSDCVGDQCRDLRLPKLHIGHRSV